MSAVGTTVRSSRVEWPTTALLMSSMRPSLHSHQIPPCSVEVACCKLRWATKPQAGVQYCFKCSAGLFTFWTEKLPPAFQCTQKAQGIAWLITCIPLCLCLCLQQEALNKAVGVVNVSLMKASPSIATAASCRPGTPFAMITNMAVSPELRRRGISHLLMQAAIKSALVDLDISPPFALLLAYKYYEPAMRCVLPGVHTQWPTGPWALHWELPTNF